MQVRFWGTRGSIAKPGPDTVRFGGNTSCVEVRTEAGTLLVLDCGTGAHGLGQALAAPDGRGAESRGGPRGGHVLITHTHWDHIQGLPFFRPLFVPGEVWHVYGPSGLGTTLQGTLAGQMQYRYFPVTLEALAAEITYHDLVEGVFEIEDVRVTARYLNHPALTLGYRIEADGATLVYATDHEPHLRELAYGRRGALSREAARHERFLAGADLVIHDAQYTAEEYAEREGWGHSTAEFVVDAACAAGVRRVALYHHDPLRADAQIDRIALRSAERAASRSDRPPEIFAAAEGGLVALDGSALTSAAGARDEPSAEEPAPDALVGPACTGGHAVLTGIETPGLARAVASALHEDGLRHTAASDGDALLAEAAAVDDGRPGLVLIEQGWQGQDAPALCRAVGELQRDGREAPTCVVLASREPDVDVERGAETGVTDWLVAPFSEAYLRTRVRCWLLRGACRWVRAAPPPDERERLGVLRGLGVLDTDPEERFDRHTRIAAALFDVPVALVSLVDAERQWFKSRQGLDVTETPRDLAFCAHAILGTDVLHVPDALADDRFADNPIVAGPPHVRFYAGMPLTVAGHRIGTLCLLDHRPRRLSEAQLESLRDLASLVEDELASRAAAAR